MVSVFRRCLWLVLVPLALGACGSDSSGSNASHHVAIALSDAGCNPPQASVETGKIAFDVNNQGSSKVTEFYVKQGDRTIGEVENVIKGSPKTLTITLKPGTYDMRCPNGTTTERSVLTVTQAGSSTTQCASAGIGGYGKESGNNGASTDATGVGSGAGDANGTGSDCGTANTSTNQTSGTTPPGGGNGGSNGNNGGGTPGGTVTPNVTTAQ